MGKTSPFLVFLPMIVILSIFGAVYYYTDFFEDIKDEIGETTGASQPKRDLIRCTFEVRNVLFEDVELRNIQCEVAKSACTKPGTVLPGQWSVNPIDWYAFDKGYVAIKVEDEKEAEVYSYEIKEQSRDKDDELLQEDFKYCFTKEQLGQYNIELKVYNDEDKVVNEYRKTLKA